MAHDSARRLKGLRALVCGEAVLRISRGRRTFWLPVQSLAAEGRCG